MKKIKKLLAMIMAMTMVLGMAMTVSAAEVPEEPVVVAPPQIDQHYVAWVTINGIDVRNATVKAYQLVFYDEEAQQYVLTTAAKNAGYQVGSTDANIVTEMAKNPANLGTEIIIPPAQSGDSYTAQLGAGTYLVIVGQTGSTLYNPMLVSVEVTQDGAAGGDVDADGYFEQNEVKVYAKSSQVNVDKFIVDEDGNDVKVDDAYAKNENITDGKVTFKLTGEIPSYSAAYEEYTYVLEDTLGAGLTIGDEAAQNTVKNNIEQQLVARFERNISDIATVTVTDTTITISFTQTFIESLVMESYRTFEITYNAILTGDKVNFEPSVNTLTLTYSDAPNHTEKKSVSTNHYTFSLDTAIAKVDVEEQTDFLKGAVFTLTDDKGTPETTDDIVFTSQPTAEDGYVRFTGLDSGTYILKEKKAPDGYQVSDMEYTVKITREFTEQNTLKNYTVTVTQGDNEVGKIVYTPGVTGGEGDIALITNTKLASLPSTGGIGTTIFTIGGCAIMIAAAALYFVNRRKSEEN